MSEAGWSQEEDRVRSVSVWRDVALGVALVLAEHVVVGGLLGGFGSLLAAQNAHAGGETLVPFFVWFFGLGLTQTAYVVPTFALTLIWRRSVAAGVALGGLVTFLLTGACFGMLCAAGMS